MEETISLTFVRDRIKAYYQIPDTKSDAFIDLKIMDSVRDILSFKYVTQKAFTLDICDFKAELPCYWKKVVAIIPPCGADTVQMIYSDFAFDGIRGNCEIAPIPNRWKIQGNFICFPSNFMYDTIDVYLDMYKVGEDGFPLLQKSHILYYEYYAGYWFGNQIKDSRVSAFVNPKTGDPKYIRTRKALIHNEQVDQFDYDKVSIAAINASLQWSGFRYFGAFNNGNTSTV